MTLGRAGLLVSIICAVCACLNPAAPTSAGQKAKASLAELALMTGHWKGEENGEVSEETWSAPDGDNMVGMFRHLKDGRTDFFEFMIIEQTAEGPALKLKHFSAGLIGWEDKAQVWTYPLVAISKSEAAFENADGSTRITYRRIGPSALTAVLEQTRNGKKKTEEFHFKAAA